MRLQKHTDFTILAPRLCLGVNVWFFETLFPSLVRREVADFAIRSERRKQSFKRLTFPKLEFGNEKEEASKE